MKHQIFSRYDNAKVIYECELPDATPSWMRTLLTLKKAMAEGSDLSGSDLSGSNLRDSDLRGSNLSDSDLSGSNLSGSNLRDSDLSGSNLSEQKNDFWEVLLRATHEVAGLRAALVAGAVDGSTYEGACACLVGTIANVRGATNYRELGNGLKPNSNRPVERWFLAIKRGDTPETNQISNITVDWLDEFVTLFNAAKA